ncbi:cryptochrome/photolyase family protein [Asticcacaulis solisilvae]|uniref:cryptochrome/photolyase family protein n=1 Tax=Asticcacaulis solisilvae TaxID=1217274 RepID=UPI003FD6E545
MPGAYVDSDAPLVLWFRTDLRLRDHPGVTDAIASGRPIIPLFIWDQALYSRPLGAASRWWLHRSLKALGEDLHRHGSRLIIQSGGSRDILDHFTKHNDVKTVVYSNTFDPKTEQFDTTLDLGTYVDFQRGNSALIVPPGTVKTKGGTPFRVFTPFYRAAVDSGLFHPHDPGGLPRGKWRAPAHWPESLTLDDLGLDDTKTKSGKDWASGFDRFTPGEGGAREALDAFIEDHLTGYANDRDRPDLDATSHLSPHLRFGEISPHRILYELDQAVRHKRALVSPAEKFRSELAWREFSYGLLDQVPDLYKTNVRREFDAFPWLDDDKGFRAWCRGETGYDLVDAGMQELWQTGYMHNRVRMICASFLTKHLLIDWRRGEQWFWDCLVDADPANNPASWQWVAGCGADAAPYFRIFNPITQAEKFDPAGRYRARWLDVRNRPKPIIDHGHARIRALQAYSTIRSKDTRHDDSD